MKHTKLVTVVLVGLGACAQPDSAEGVGPMLRINLAVDSSQQRLDNFGEPLTEVTPGHAAADPRFLWVGAHSAELVPTQFTMLGAGTMVFDTAHRNDAVDFADLPIVAPGDELRAVPLAQVPAGTHAYLRLAVSFQRFEVTGWASVGGTEVSTNVEIASFVEGKTYIDSYELGDEVVEVNAVKLQGYYGAWSAYTSVIEGQGPPGATTVPNPIDATSPIPVSSCVVTAIFDEPFEISGDETSDITLNVTLSTNQSFEWEDDNADGRWQPLDESVVDMGLRGMRVTVER